jgi:peptide/nickel transport system substrate-binding protein
MTRPRLAALAAVLVGSCALTACAGGGSAEQATAPTVTTSVPAPTRDVGSLTWNVPAGEPPRA